ncbi:uncharacterized protein MELLADRAFT_77991 [Melampsora larici-populina 98AG31]|uniref:DNA repair metallo-beta-lactamase domain-containing protein n=1 Tax=Melampsora larici-populina (strain 98AG31 / pathotype 3-4-7) TaxID=747676 RepID=F4RP86_MELLP|nr:uncharacterized protein MELLADRAFT_77991 [Melampsora larici-populina 98AG31]EGG05775.1 hypothetical protein MELLADRAFT_77991 [Melampsora larici-populina 98AG31]
MSTFDGYFREFDGLIRADNFTKDYKSIYHSKSVLYLLSHIHSDHTNGLNTFNDQDLFIYCSFITKETILNTKTFNQRYPLKSTSPSKKSKEYKFENLQQHPFLKAISLRKPTEIILKPTENPDENQTCCITLFDANHCPGSVMFLIQMWNKSVLYTGDIRAEPWWIESLTKESILAPFLDFNHAHQFSNHHHNRIKLDNIYLDTSGLVYKKDVLTKEQAILSTLRLMSFYPDDTIFFINTWTWGWEELLERISIHFQTLIHVDQYKFDLYTLPNFEKHYPLLTTSITLDCKSTRFHACERKQRCEECEDERYLNQYCPDHLQNGMKERKPFGRVVTVNPMEIDEKKWSSIKVQLEGEIKLAIEEEKNGVLENDLWPTLIISPFTRHSSFKELHKLVSIFKPKTLFPNTTQPSKGFIEYHLLPILFRSVLSEGSIERLEQEVQEYIDQYSKQIGSLMIIESQVIHDLMESLPRTFSQFHSGDHQDHGHSKPMEMKVDEIFEKFDELDVTDEVFVETFLNDEEEKQQTISLLNSIGSQDKTIQDDQSMSNGFNSKDFLSSGMIDLTKHDDHPLTSSTNKSDRTDPKRSMIEETQDDHPKKSKLTFKETTNQSTPPPRLTNSTQPNLSENDHHDESNSEEFAVHPFYTSDSINQKLTNLSIQVNEVNQRWLKSLNDLQLDLTCDLEESLVYQSLAFQNGLVDLILISKELNHLKLFIIDFIHQIYS